MLIDPFLSMRVCIVSCQIVSSPCSKHQTRQRIPEKILAFFYRQPQSGSCMFAHILTHLLKILLNIQSSKAVRAAFLKNGFFESVKTSMEKTLDDKIKSIITT